MSLTKSELLDSLSRDLSPVEPEYGEDVYSDGPWPREEEQRIDAERFDFD